MISSLSGTLKVSLKAGSRRVAGGRRAPTREADVWLGAVSCRLPAELSRRARGARRPQDAQVHLAGGPYPEESSLKAAEGRAWAGLDATCYTWRLGQPRTLKLRKPGSTHQPLRFILFHITNAGAVITARFVRALYHYPERSRL